MNADQLIKNATDSGAALYEPGHPGRAEHEIEMLRRYVRELSMQLAASKAAVLEMCAQLIKAPKATTITTEEAPT